MSSRSILTRSRAWKQRRPRPKSHDPGCSTASGSGARTGRSTPASSSASRSTPSRRLARIASPGGRGPSCWPRAGASVDAIVRHRPSSRTEKHRSPRWPPRGDQRRDRRPSLRQPEHRRLPPAEGVPEARYHLPATAPLERVRRGNVVVTAERGGGLPDTRRGQSGERPAPTSRPNRSAPSSDRPHRPAS